jgi:hypothetical protein
MESTVLPSDVEHGPPNEHIDADAIAMRPVVDVLFMAEQRKVTTV